VPHGQHLTIIDLARRLDLSPAAVSYALNNRPGVSQQTRDRVQALARELGWYPSASAQALSRARTGSIGVVLSRTPELIGTEPYYMQIIAGIERVLTEANMSLTLRMVDPDSGADLAIYERWAGERRVEGVILFDEHVDDPRLPLLEGLELPAVLQGGPSGSSIVLSVENDDEEVAEMIVDAFAALGHEQITYLTGPQQMMHERRRLAAVIAQAERRGLRLESIEGDYTLGGARELVTQRLSADPLPTAITCSNDLMSISALHAIEEAGLAVPGDISLISWDDSLLCSITRPEVTAVDRHPVAYGMRTAQVLLSLIRGEPGDLPAPPRSQLVVRGTTGPAPGWLPTATL